MPARSYSRFTLPALLSLVLLLGGCSSPPFESGDTVLIVPGEIRIGTGGLVPIWASGQVIEYKDQMFKVQIRQAETAGDREWSREWPVGDTVWVHVDKLVPHERGQAALERQRLAAGYATDLILGSATSGEDLDRAILAAGEEGLDDLHAMLSFHRPLASMLNRIASLQGLGPAIRATPGSDPHRAFAESLRTAGDSLEPDAHKVAVAIYQALENQSFRGPRDRRMQQLLMQNAAGVYAGDILHRMHQMIRSEDAFLTPEATEHVVLLERALLTALTGGGETPLASPSDARSFAEWLDIREADVRRQRGNTARDEILAKHMPRVIDEDAMETAFSKALAEAADVEPFLGIPVLEAEDKQSVYLRWIEQRTHEAKTAWSDFQERLDQFARSEMPIDSLSHWHFHMDSVETVDRYLVELEELGRHHGDLVPEINETLAKLHSQQQQWNKHLEEAVPVFEQFVQMIKEGNEREARDLAVPGVSLHRSGFRLRSGEYYLRDEEDLFLPEDFRVRRVSGEVSRQKLLAASRRFVNEIESMMIVDVQTPAGSWVEDIRLYHHDGDWFLGTRWW